MNTAAPVAAFWSRPRVAVAAAVVLATALLLGLLLYALLPGLARTADSRHYLAAAASFAETGQLLNADGTPYTSWGPLYPLLLALGSRHVLAWATGLHVLASLTCLWSWGYLAMQLLPRRAVVAWSLLVLALAAPWLITAKFIWAEAGFQALFGLYAVALYRWLRTRRPGWLIAATVAGVLLPLQRTSGVFLLLGVGAGLVLAYPAELRRHWRALNVHAVIISSAAGSWLWHAQHVAAQPEVYRSRGWQGLRETLGDYGYVLTRWLVPVQQAGWPKHWLFELLLPALLLALAAMVWRSRQPFLRLLGAVLLTYILCHIGITVLSRAGGNVYDVERYAAAVYGPFVLLLAEAAGRLAVRRCWVLLVLACWLAYPAVRAARVARFCHQLPVPIR
ncbi:hypothetical protein [Hymenobacter jeollabukensis]|uniref:Glycosyltransferase RgtA/B/C/D-like domain-containing protein n=1 Tax=Hymenobacter jeollabukensis TaxID=2025313 RepID=A0A5R8WIC9_9BACT|nr:hypothetical protein [Hymenobacter jeollabukensis]TLM88346.1 hypothetical protein FDY95_24515 [Hymenobacter jeollabukensis]